MSLSYSNHPSPEVKQNMSDLLHAFAMMYPCKHCRLDFQEKIKEKPPRLDSREEFALWVCE